MLPNSGKRSIDFTHHSLGVKKRPEKCIAPEPIDYPACILSRRSSPGASGESGFFFITKNPKLTPRIHEMPRVMIYTTSQAKLDQSKYLLME